MTPDLVTFLSREQQIRIFKQRRRYWTVAGALLGILIARTVLGAATAGWLWVLVPTALLLGLLFWATYVPVVMAPGRPDAVSSPGSA